MNTYQILLLAAIYGATAYGAYRERKANVHRFDEQHYWIVAFIFFTVVIGVIAFTSLFILVGTL